MDQIQKLLGATSNETIVVVHDTPRVTSMEILDQLETMLHQIRINDTKPSPDEYEKMLYFISVLKTDSLIMPEKVDKLQAQVYSLQAENTKLTNQGDSLQLEVDSLKLEVDSLKLVLQDSISKSKGNAAYLKFQDLHARFFLELHMTNRFSKLNFKKLRNGRNYTAHLYDEADDVNVQAYKTVKAVEMLKNMNSASVTKFTENFGPSFIQAVVQHFEGGLNFFSWMVTTDPDEITLANEWWMI